MAMTPYHTRERGITLLVSIIFMSVVLALGLALGSLAYKQQVLASGASDSQYAFYAADAALECVLYFDQQQNLFAFDAYDSNSPTKNVTCDGSTTVFTQAPDGSNNNMISTGRISLDSNTRCADVTVYKPNGLGTSYVFSQGYNVSCNALGASARVASRGISIHY